MTYVGYKTYATYIRWLGYKNTYFIKSLVLKYIKSDKFLFYNFFSNI